MSSGALSLLLILGKVLSVLYLYFSENFLSNFSKLYDSLLEPPLGYFCEGPEVGYFYEGIDTPDLALGTLISGRKPESLSS